MSEPFFTHDQSFCIWCWFRAFCLLHTQYTFAAELNFTNRLPNSSNASFISSCMHRTANFRRIPSTADEMLQKKGFWFSSVGIFAAFALAYVRWCIQMVPKSVTHEWMTVLFLLRCQICYILPSTFGAHFVGCCVSVRRRGDADELTWGRRLPPVDNEPLPTYTHWTGMQKKRKIHSTKQLARRNRFVLEEDYRPTEPWRRIEISLKRTAPHKKKRSERNGWKTTCSSKNKATNVGVAERCR